MTEQSPYEQEEVEPQKQARRSCLGCFGCLGRLFALGFILLVLVTGGIIFDFIFDPPFGSQTTARVLLVGLDQPESKRDNRRSDSLMLCAVRLNGGGITLLSIPRDALVTIPHHRKAQKINAAYALGKLPLLRATLAQSAVLRADLPYHIVFDSATVGAMVEALGGVEVNVPQEMHYIDHWQNLKIDLHAGMQHLYGEQVVGYLRWRKNNDGYHGGGDDFKRMQRQRDLLSALMQRARTWDGLRRLPAVYRAYEEHTPEKTNLDVRQFLLLALSARQIQTQAVPATPVMLRGVSYVECDWRKGRELWTQAQQ